MISEPVQVAPNGDHAPKEKRKKHQAAPINLDFNAHFKGSSKVDHFTSESAGLKWCAEFSQTEQANEAAGIFI